MKTKFDRVIEIMRKNGELDMIRDYEMLSHDEFEEKWGEHENK